jgi:hypothetical protein
MRQKLDLPIKGIWWLPEDPTNRVAGELSLDDNGQLVAELMGRLGVQIDDAFRSAVRDVPVVFGTSLDGDHLTLYAARIYLMSWTSENTARTRITCRFGVLGDHVSPPLNLRTMAFSFPQLQRWYGKTGLENSAAWPLVPVREGFVKYKLLDRDTIYEKDGKTITIGLSVEMLRNDDSGGLGFTGYREHCNIEVFCSKLTPIDQVFQTIRALRNLLTLLTGRIVSFDRTVIEGGIQGFRHELLGIPEQSRKKSARNISDNFLIAFSELERSVTTVLENWFQKYSELEPICNLHFGALYNPRLYIENKFLNVAQAVEAYHRRFVNNLELPQDKHEERVKTIIGSCPQAYQPWLKEKLAFSNEPTLKQRLKELLGKHPVVTQAFIGDEDAFIKKVKNTRNYLTHFNDSLRKKCATGTELSSLAQQLRILLEACLLKELGVPAEDVANVLIRHYPSRHLQTKAE